jgi:hypothetical protein
VAQYQAPHIPAAQLGATRPVAKRDDGDAGRGLGLSPIQPSLHTIRAIHLGGRYAMLSIGGKCLAHLGAGLLITRDQF